MRHAGGSPHHHHTLHFGRQQLCVVQRALYHLHAALRQGCRGSVEIRTRHGLAQRAGRQLRHKFGAVGVRQPMLAGTGRHHQRSTVFRTLGLDAGACQHLLHQRTVVVIPAQRRIAAGGNHLEHALRQAQDGNVKRATTQIEHGVDALAGVIQAIGNGSRRRFVDQAQHLQTGQLGRILGRLALGVVEIRRHGDHGTVQIVIESVFGAIAQRGENFSAHFHRRLVTTARADAHHALGRILGHKLVGQMIAMAGADVVQATPHEALDRHNRVLRIIRHMAQRLGADLAAAVIQITHRRGQDHLAIRIRQTLGQAMAHGGHQRMRGAEVNANGNAPLVRIGRLPGFGDLEECHRETVSAQRPGAARRESRLPSSGRPYCPRLGAQPRMADRRPYQGCVIETLNSAVTAAATDADALPGQTSG